MSGELRFDGKVAIITGAGGGLGRSHALLLASRGAKVLVNDLGGSARGEGAAKSAADKVVDEIRAAGGEAAADYNSVTDGDKIVASALEAFGKIDIVVNNAGILRDVSFGKMTDEDWDLVYKVHLEGAYKVTHAAWPHMRAQGYGRIVMTTSAAGIYGNFGQANYSACKLALAGFSNTLAIEGANRGVQCNTIAPIAGSRLMATVLPPELVEALKPEYVSPLVAYLCHESCAENGGLFEVGAGWMAKLRWERTKGAFFHLAEPISVEKVADKWSALTDFTGATRPKTTQDSFGPILQNLNTAHAKKVGNENIDVARVLGHEFKPQTVNYTRRDAVLYALGIGAGKNPLDASDLPFVYELNSGGFKVFPTLAVTFPFQVITQVVGVPGLKFNPMMLLHGEQFLEVKKPLAPEAKIASTAKITQVYDKGKGALLIVEATSRDEAGEEIAFNQYSLFIRGIGGFGGDRGPAGEANEPPSRPPDAVAEEKTTDNQALLYRLSGDPNPLHADPSMAAMGGFEKPILHGLCTFGIAARAVLKHFAGNDPARFKSIKVRFAKHVFPGETIVTEMWKESDSRIVFRVKAAERGEVVLSNAAIELRAAGEAARRAASAPASSASANGGDPRISAIFEEMGRRVSANPDLASKVGALFQFEIGGAPGQDWIVDLKSAPGSVSRGRAEKPDCTLTISGDDYLDLVGGRLAPQAAFMQGKLKIGGNMMLASKLELIMKQ